MLQITCPHCGPRNEIEFAYGGETHIVRPAIDSGDEAWADYLFFRHNPKGVTFERWRHAFGCRGWFNVSRDTRSHAIRAVYAMTDPQPIEAEDVA